MNKQIELTINDHVEINKEETVTAAKAMKMLELSRHNFEKMIQQGLIVAIQEGTKKVYSVK